MAGDPSTENLVNQETASPREQFITLADHATRMLGALYPEKDESYRVLLPETVAQFASLSLSRQTQVLNNLQLFFDVVVSIAPLRQMPDRAFEIDFLLRFLDRAGLQAPDKSFLEKVTEGDIIDVFNAQGAQLYRSWSVFQTCSYSLPQLLVYSPDCLFQRTGSPPDGISQRFPQILSVQTNIIDFESEANSDYSLQEHMPGHSLAHHLKTRFCSGLLGKASKAPEAFIVISSKQLVQTHSATKRLNFV